jgi:hypothetical protein
MSHEWDARVRRHGWGGDMVVLAVVLEPVLREGTPSAVWFEAWRARSWSPVSMRAWGHAIRGAERDLDMLIAAHLTTIEARPRG